MVPLVKKGEGEKVEDYANPYANSIQSIYGHSGGQVVTG